MKKLLALVLAMVMTLGLATVSTSAAFSDADSIKYKEAVEVMSAIGVLNGTDKGTFEPAGTLTREAAAKIIAYMLLGEDTAEKLAVDKVPFSDVAADRWSAPYIAYCVANKIVDGRGDGTFDPAGNLTGHAFGKMLLTALGVEGEFTGDSWAINVATAVAKNGLDDEVSSVVLSKDLTREQAAQFAFNAVKYNGTESAYGVDTNGDKKADITFDNRTDALLYAGTKDTYEYVGKVQNTENSLLDEVFGVTVTNGTDDFGRPATVYTKAGDKNWDDLKFADDASYSFVADSAIAKEKILEGVNKALGFTKDSNKLTADTAKISKNGGAEEAFGASIAIDVGDEVEVYAAKGAISKVIVKEYTFGEIDKVDTDVTEAKADDGVSAYVTIKGGATFDDTDFADFNASTYTKGTKVAYILATDGKSVIASYLPEVVSNVSFTSRAKDQKSAVAGGTTYKAYLGDTLFGAATLGTSYTYDLYLDASGKYVMGFEATSTETTLDDVYYVVAKFKKDAAKDEYGVPGDASWFVQVVALDGTISSIQVKDEAAADAAVTAGVVSFSKVAKKDYMNATAYTPTGDYARNTISGKPDLTATSKTLAGQYLNGDTQYIVVTTEDGKLAKTKASVKTGGVAYDDVEGYAIGHKSGTAFIAEYVILTAGTEAKTEKEDLLFAKSELTDYTETTDDDGGNYNLFRVYGEDGKTKDIKVSSSTKTIPAGFSKYAVDSDGFYTLSTATAVSLTENTVWTKSVVGTLEGASFKSYFGGLLKVSKDSKELSEITASTAVVADLHATDGADQYNKTVTSLETLDSLLNGSGTIKSATMSLSINEDGVVVIYITDISTK